MRKSGKYLSLFLALVMALSLGAVPALAAPEVSVAETVIYDDELATVTVTDFDAEYDYGPTFEMLVENKSDKEMGFRMDYVSVNGMKCDPNWLQRVAGGKKAYDDMYWYAEDLEAVGVNYIQDVQALLVIYDGESYETLVEAPVSWSTDVSETDLPAWEPVVFDGFAEQTLLATEDLECSVVNFEPNGNYDDGPLVTFYVRNDTDKLAYFNADDVSVNGFMCDPSWGEVLLPGTAAYSRCDWWAEDLEDSHIDTMETMEFTLSVLDYDEWEELASESVTVDLTGAAPAAPAEEPEAAEEPETAEEPAAAGTSLTPDGMPVMFGPEEEGYEPVVGWVDDDHVYHNEAFGVDIALPEGTYFYDLADLAETSFGEEAEMVWDYMESETVNGMFEASAAAFNGDTDLLVGILPDGVQILHVWVQTLGPVGMTGFQTAEEIADALTENDDSMERGTVTIGGVEWPCVSQGAQITVNGEPVDIRDEVLPFFYSSSDRHMDYVMCVSLSGASDEDMADLYQLISLP